MLVPVLSPCPPVLKKFPCGTALQEAQLNDVLFELDRRAAKLLLKPLDVDFVDS